jgi:phosphatidylglycerol:prolipoprotein diacylglycerol transferase
VRIGAWPLLVAAGAVVALLTQRFLADRVGLHPVQLLLVSLLACLLGVAGAKAYYLATHPAERRNILTAGMSIQGFVLAAVATLLGGSFILGLPIGQVLDVSAPALLAGMAVGRVGCLLGGCCSGRPTTSRWGIWSSDRRLGTVRIPVQLMESAATAVVAVATAAANLVSDGRPAGVIFTTGVGVYVAVRQVLFPLRVLPRATAFGRPVSLLVSVAVSVVSIAIGLSA